MCGIVGLFLKDTSLESRLGALVAPMLVALSDRGPDSTGFAVYGTGSPSQTKFSLRGRADTDFDEIAAQLGGSLGEVLAVTRRDSHAVLTVPSTKADLVPSGLEAIAPEVAVVGVGERMELYKEVGSPTDVTTRIAVEPQWRPPRSAARGHHILHRERYRGRSWLHHLADASGAAAGIGIASRADRARWVLHLRRRHRVGVRRVAGSDRLQAGGDGRNR